MLAYRRGKAAPSDGLVGQYPTARRSGTVQGLEIAAPFLTALASLTHDLVRLLLNIPLVAARHRAAVGDRQLRCFGLQRHRLLQAGFALFGRVGALERSGIALQGGLVVAVVEVIGDRAGGLRYLRQQVG